MQNHRQSPAVSVPSVPLRSVLPSKDRKAYPLHCTLQQGRIGSFPTDLAIPQSVSMPSPRIDKDQKMPLTCSAPCRSASLYRVPSWRAAGREMSGRPRPAAMRMEQTAVGDVSDESDDDEAGTRAATVSHATNRPCQQPVSSPCTQSAQQFEYNAASVQPCNSAAVQHRNRCASPS